MCDAELQSPGIQKPLRMLATKRSKSDMQILLLEDDLQLGRALQAALAQCEFAPVWVRQASDATKLLQTRGFKAALLDIGLQDGSGLDVLAWLRSEGNTLPVMMLTARDSVSDRILGLDTGADDYLPKPFAIPELISRLRALCRRSAGFAQQVWRVGAISIEPARQRVLVDDQVVVLTTREYKLLLELARHAGRFVTRSNLEAVVFGDESSIESNALEVHVHHLRKRLGTGYIKTIRGVGYLLEDGT
jgi:two-component system, OmpR family, response regulator QseB